MALLVAETLEARQPPEQRAQLCAMPEGVAGIRYTLNAMSKLTRQFKTDPDIIELARNIVRAVPEKNYFQEASAIQQWVRDNIRYVRDVADVETLATPIETLRQRSGDCDDKSLLAGSLLAAIGFPVRYVAWAFDAPDLFEHVYAEINMGRHRSGHWLGVETTEPVAIGWKPDSPFAPMVAHV